MESLGPKYYKTFLIIKDSNNFEEYIMATVATIRKAIESSKKISGKDNCIILT